MKHKTKETPRAVMPFLLILSVAALVFASSTHAALVSHDSDSQVLTSWQSDTESGDGEEGDEKPKETEEEPDC